MRTIDELPNDERAVSATVTHALALAITAILISGLLLAAGILLEDQRENSAREQLRTVGNRMAGDLSKAATLAQDGGNVTVRTRQPTAIAGRSYHVTFHTGVDCDTRLFETEACLELTLQDGPTVFVPVRNETGVEFRSLSGGRYVVSAVANRTATPPTVPAQRMDLRVGVGEDIGEFASGTAVNLTNRNPISGFTFSPGQPTVDSIIHFQNDTRDLDGVITSYEWDLDGDGTTDRTGREINHSYAEPGRYTVRLTVTDDDGESDTVSKVVSVGGLVYNHDAAAVNVSPTVQDGAIHFSVTNNHSTEVDVKEVLIDPETDPADGGADRLDSESSGDPYEVEIHGDVAEGDYDGAETIYAGGHIFDVADASGPGTGAATLSPGDVAQVEFNGFEKGLKLDMYDQDVFVSMRYEAGGEFHTAQFTLFGPGGGGDDPPEADFDWSCPTAPTCSFTDTSTDPGASSIASYQWSFGDGETSTQQDPSHVYATNGSYQATLTVVDTDGTSSSVTKTVGVGDPEPVLLFAVNAGGGSRTYNGVTYEEDTEYDPHPFHTGDNRDDLTYDTIANTTQDELYRTVRLGDPSYYGYPPGSFGYDVPVPDGQYAVTLKFSEIDRYADPGERNFEVDLEGSTVLSDVDVEAAVGEDHALDYTRVTSVSDGELNIDFKPDTNQRPPMVSAVFVQQLYAESYQEGSNRVVMEAEGSMRTIPGTGEMSGDSWEPFSDVNASGGTGLVGQPDYGDNAQDTTEGERLDYYVDLASTGPYYVWVRMRCPGGGGDSVHVGLDGTPESYGDVGLTANATDTCSSVAGEWMWASHADGSQVTLNPTTTGQHTLNVWMREDGTRIDKVVITSDPGYAPTDDGPQGPATSPVS